MAPPHKDFLNLRALPLSDLKSDIRARLVIDKLPVAVVSVHVDHHAASGVGRSKPGGLATESAEHDRMDDAQPGTRQHGDYQLRNHGHVNRDAIAGSEPAEIAQDRRDLIHTGEQFLVGDRVDRLILGFRDKNERSLVLVLC